MNDQQMLEELRATAPRARTLAMPETQGYTLLAIDTSLGTSVALSHEGRVHELTHDDPRGHAEVVGTLLAELFSDAGVATQHVSAVVVGIGPGPFTGLRVGIAAAYGFAAGRQLPLLPLSGHEAVALAMLESRRGSDPLLQSDTSPAIRTVQDAKRRELFVSEFGELDSAGLPQSIAPAHIIARSAYVEAQYEVWPERIPAARLIQGAARRLRAQRDFEPNEALYLRKPDVAQPSAPKRVST